MRSSGLILAFFLKARETVIRETPMDSATCRKDMTFEEELLVFEDIRGIPSML